MNINITARKFRAKDSLKEHINESLKSLQKFNEDILQADVILSFTHLKDSIKTVEINLHIPGNFLTVTEESDDYTKAVNAAVEVLARQLKKVKSKRLSVKAK